ncbi:hypothetical protein ACOSP7_009603 [Xanthoceras sorbifolium]
MKEAFGPKKNPNNKKDGGRSPQDKSKRKNNSENSSNSNCNRNRGSQKDGVPTNQVAKKARNDEGVGRNRGCYQTYAQLSDSQDKIFNTDERGRVWEAASHEDTHANSKSQQLLHIP